jgi:hypothetical protein
MVHASAICFLKYASRKITPTGFWGIISLFSLSHAFQDWCSVSPFVRDGCLVSYAMDLMFFIVACFLLLCTPFQHLS